MAFINWRGEETTPHDKLTPAQRRALEKRERHRHSLEELERLGDLMALDMHLNGMGQRAIGFVLNIDQVTVGRRLRAIPPGVRAFHEAQPRWDPDKLLALIGP